MVRGGLQAAGPLGEQAGAGPTLLPPGSPKCRGHPFPAPGSTFSLDAHGEAGKSRGLWGLPRVSTALRRGYAGHLSALMELWSEPTFPAHLEECGRV